MKKIIRLTESDLTRLIKKVITESEDEDENIQTNDLTPEITVQPGELEQHAQAGTLPQSVKVPQILNNPIGKEVISTVDEYCSQGQSKESIISFLKGKLREFRQRKRAARKQKGQVQEQALLIGIAVVAGWILICLLLIKIFRGGDGCGRYVKWRNRHFVGYN